MDDWALTITRGLGLGETPLRPGDLLLLGALAGCTVFALVQLLVLHLTRYGDQNQLTKSFVASIVLHICLGLGWATAVSPLWKPADVGASDLGEDPREQEQTRVVLQQDLTDESFGNTSRLDLPPEVSHVTPERTELRPAESDPFEETRSPVTPQESPDWEFTELPASPDDVSPAPALESSIATATPEIAPDDRLEEPEQPIEVAPRNSLIERTLPTTERMTDSLPERVAPSPAATAAERLAVDSARDTSSIPLETSTIATEPKPVGPLTEMIRRSAAPAAAIDGGDEVVDAPPAPVDSSRTGPRFQRSQRTPRGQAGIAEGDAPSVDQRASRGSIDRVGTPGPVPELASVTPLDRESMTRPELLRPGSQPRKGPVRSPATYRLRELQQRSDIAIRNGGSKESEAAVERALEFFAKSQEPDGRWNPGRFDGGSANRTTLDPPQLNRREWGWNADSGVTGLIVLAYLGAGYTHESGQYAATVEQALVWLTRQQRDDGYLAGEATYFDAMYCHAIATFALAEAYGMQKDSSAFPELRPTVEKAVNFIVRMQNKDGGWRYRANMSESDMSMFGWQLMALKSAEIAGVAVPLETRRGMVRFLKERAKGEDNGLAAYRSSEQPSRAMTAEALFCRQMLGIRRSHPSCTEAVSFVQQGLPRISETNEYYWYYGTLAMFQYGGDAWDRWNDSLRDLLVKTQKNKGPDAGSWDPVGPWSTIGGRLYSTAMSTLCLEVYYRFLPLYRATDTAEDTTGED